MKIRFIVLSILILSTGTVFSQGKLPTFTSNDFQAFELKIGAGKLQTQLLSFEINYQKNLSNNFSFLSFTQINFSAWGRNPDKKYLVINHFHILQTIGIGANAGGKRFNSGIYLLAGGRYYHSKAIVKGINEPELNTNRLLPEVGLMYNYKAGKNKFYFCGQLYLPLTPFAMKFFEKNTTLSLGVGYKIYKKNKSTKKESL